MELEHELGGLRQEKLDLTVVMTKYENKRKDVERKLFRKNGELQALKAKNVRFIKLLGKIKSPAEYAAKQFEAPASVRRQLFTEGSEDDQLTEEQLLAALDEAEGNAEVGEITTENGKVQEVATGEETGNRENVDAEGRNTCDGESANKKRKADEGGEITTENVKVEKVATGEESGNRENVDAEGRNKSDGESAAKKRKARKVKKGANQEGQME